MLVSQSLRINFKNYIIVNCVRYRSFSRKTSIANIEEAYQRPELRKAIFDRFQLTLALDPRYRVIALLIAYRLKNVSSIFQ
jgi:hypothetical protein